MSLTAPFLRRTTEGNGFQLMAYQLLSFLMKAEFHSCLSPAEIILAHATPTKNPSNYRVIGNSGHIFSL